MNTLVFGVIWTVIAAAMAIGLMIEPDFSQQSLFYKVIFTTLPVAGLLPIRDGLRRVRRHRSVRQEEGSDGPVYVWISFDGSEQRDTTDPRPVWEAEDRNFSDN